MADVLANTTPTAEQGGQHDTTAGSHNLNMIGDMPVAHGEGSADAAQPAEVAAAAEGQTWTTCCGNMFLL